MLHIILKLTARITAWALLKKYPNRPVDRTELWRAWKYKLSEYIKA